MSSGSSLTGLSYKVFRNSMVIAILGIGLTLSLSYELHMGYYRKALERDLVEDARQAIRTVDTALYVGLLHARYLAQLSSIHRVFDTVQRPDPLALGADLEPFLTARVWHITVLDLAGRPLATTRRQGGTLSGPALWWMQVIEWGAWVGEPYRDPAEAVPLIPVAVLAEHPETGRPAGIIRVELNWQNFTDALASMRSAFHVAYAFVADARGRILLHYDPSMIHRGLDEIGGADVVAQARSRDTGVVRARLQDPRSGFRPPLVIGFAHSTGTYEYPARLDWWSGVVVSERDIFKDVYASMVLGGTLTALVAALLIVGAYFGTRSILAPLASITEVMGRFGEARGDRRLSVQTGDELEILADTFNTMADALRRSHEQLESKIHELLAANVRLEELARLKSQLCANVSHELRTPLHSILAFTELALKDLRGKASDVAVDNLDRVRRNAYRLTDTINQFLDFSKLESGAYPTTVEDVDLAQEMAACRDLIAPLVGSRVELTIEAPGPLPIRSNGQMIRQILVNLVSNALKFTQVGHVRLGARIAGDRAIVAVEDTGIGIDAKDLDAIFDEFHQVDGSLQRNQGGTGLGLAIVKRMVAALGGQIHVESRIGVGSTFTVDLPVVAPPSSVAAAAHAAPQLPEPHARLAGTGSGRAGDVT